MPKDVRLNFNRGLISRLALGRQDLDRTNLAAEIQTNWMPRVLGPMSLRPGWEFISATKSNLQARNIPFIFSSVDIAIIQLTNLVMRVLVDEEPITRVAVTATVANGTFTTNLSNWTDADETGATSAWLAGGYMSLIGTGYNRAIRKQTITITEAATEHALRIVVFRGPVTLRVGSTDGGEEYINETNLGTGTHSLAFTPSAGSCYLHLSSRTKYAALVDSIAIEGAGIMEITTPWATEHLYATVGGSSLVRYTASADILYVACEGMQQRKIERRSTRSWSVVLYEPVDGPFRIENVTALQLAVSAMAGDITVTASAPLFKAAHVGALFSIDSVGQFPQLSGVGSSQFTDPVRVTGVGAARNMMIYITGTWAGTLTLQRSTGGPGSWVDVASYTANTTEGYNDTLDNQITYYRIGFKAAAYTSGTAVMGLEFSGGSITGIVRITAVATPVSASAAVLADLGHTNASDVWAEGAWSDYRGWPSADELYEGRLWWAGKTKQWATISDAYESLDDTLEGDAGPISRSIGEGPVDTVNWLLAVERLMMGTAGAERYAHSSSLDEPISPTRFDLKRFSTQGSARIAAIAVDDEALFVQRSRYKIYSISASSDRFTSIDITALVPELGNPGFTHIAVQRQPDTRIHCVRSDGTVAVLVYDLVENVRGWVEVETNGEVEDVVVLPDVGEDAVYYVVKRTVNGSTVRYLEKWAQSSECVGGSLNKQADSFVSYTGGATIYVQGLDHLEGEDVVVWGDGADLGTFTVSGGQVTLDAAVSNAVAGLGYTADYKSTKLRELDIEKGVHHVNLLLADVHAEGLQYGQDFDHLDELPLIEGGVPVPTGTVWEEYHNDSVSLNYTFDVDARICLRATAPRPCTVLAVVIES